ncbi:hypothetical protein Q8F55_005058 [Vanrija albida]|uniref:Uncharacterized protein n=1 Tax=Vanrija albida TaxID=181172 RepID=A0ABR3Q0W7_9TREE
MPNHLLIIWRLQAPISSISSTRRISLIPINLIRSSRLLPASHMIHMRRLITTRHCLIIIPAMEHPRSKHHSRNPSTHTMSRSCRVKDSWTINPSNS